MKVVGLYLLRNEVDLVEVNLSHHFATAIDEAIVIDNGSTDGTLEKLIELADSMPIQLASEPGPYDQSNRVTRMARLAVQNGADWVLPIDADEFWVGIDATLRSILGDLPDDVSGVRAEIVNFVQRRDVLSAGPHSLLSMTMRPESQVGPIEDCERLVEAEQIGFVEMMYPPKWVSRASPDIVVHNGNHSVEGLPEGTTTTGQVLCLHAPLRARSLLTGKLDQGRRVIEDEGRQDYWHVRRWWRLCREGTIEAEWAANSFENGSITVGARERRLIEDDRLRHAVSPHVSGTGPEELDEREAAHPAVAAYLLALDTVPGEFDELDFLLTVELDRIQQANTVAGDLLEIGTGSVKSAILLGHLAGLSHDVLSVCGSVEELGPEGPDISYATEDQESGALPPGFADQYVRFHTRLPAMLGPGPKQIDVGSRQDSFRIVHIGGRPDYDSARVGRSGLPRMSSGRGESSCSATCSDGTIPGSRWRYGKRC